MAAAERQAGRGKVVASAQVAARLGDQAVIRAWRDGSTGDRFAIVEASMNLSLVSEERGDYATARAHYGKALAIYRQLGDWQGQSWVLSNLDLVSPFSGRLHPSLVVR